MALFTKKREVKLPDVKLPDVRLPDVKLPDVRLPDVRLPDVTLPTVSMPQVALPTVNVPQVSLPSRVDIPELHVPSVQIAGLRTPELRTPELELVARNGLQLRRKRANPIWVGLKFVVGLGLGLLVGMLVAALLAPAAGDDTRHKLRGMLPTGGGSGTGGDASSISTPSTGPVAAVKARFQVAVEEARKTRELRERELLAEFETAKRTGTAP